jgi:S-adenosylmethionine decarboxylase
VSLSPESEFFEGREKRLEISVSASSPSLRALGDDAWQRVVRAARAEVLSVVRNDACDAFLLSESSLFVFDRRATMITCGRTRLADAAAALVAIVSPRDVTRLLFQRPADRVPGHQATTFAEDAEALGRLVRGDTYQLGEPASEGIALFASCDDDADFARDPTFEIRMHGIDRRRAHAFASTNASKSIAEGVGLRGILPGYQLDENVFTPAGYSLNAIRDDRYYTVHVTPEGLGRYASFTTNVDLRPELEHIVDRLLETFEPSAFDVVAFTPEGDVHPPQARGYALGHRSDASIVGYQVTFLAFFRDAAYRSGPSSTGPGRR